MCCVMLSRIPEIENCLFLFGAGGQKKLEYSTMLTLLDTCLSKIDINEFTDRVLNGITDEDEIKVLCYLMLIRLSHIAPTTVTSRELSFPL